ATYYCTTLLISPHFFLFTAPPPPETSPLSLHDALPIYGLTEGGRRLGEAVLKDVQPAQQAVQLGLGPAARDGLLHDANGLCVIRSEEHTSELQSPYDLVCRLLLEKKKKKKKHKHEINNK